MSEQICEWLMDNTFIENLRSLKILNKNKICIFAISHIRFPDSIEQRKYWESIILQFDLKIMHWLQRTFFLTRPVISSADFYRIKKDFLEHDQITNDNKITSKVYLLFTTPPPLPHHVYARGYSCKIKDLIIGIALDKMMTKQGQIVH